jgi:hypothetical protein
MSAGRRGSRCSARPRNWRPSRRKLAYRDRLDFRSCGQAPVRNGFTLASLCRCGVPSGDFGIGVVTQGSDRPLDKALWAEIEIDEIAAYTIAQHCRSRWPIQQSGSAKLKAQEWPWADHSLRAGPPGDCGQQKRQRRPAEAARPRPGSASAGAAPLSRIHLR